MSQRRGGSSQKEPAVAVEEEAVPFGEVLDQPKVAMSIDRKDLENPPGAPLAVASLSLDARYEAETREMRTKQWKEGHFAAGMTPSTWTEEYQKWREHPRQQCLSLDDTEGAPCGCCSSVVCGLLGAGRVGNMAVLKQSTEWAEEEAEDENGDLKVHRFTRPRLDIVVGPYWPMLIFVTYPLILGVSFATLVSAIPGKPLIIVLIWGSCTVGLIYSLAMTAFRDPGILARQSESPDETWRWSDRAHSYRPRGAWFDPDTGVIVEDFDHTCPWTGTAIGKKNLKAFHFFVALVFVCLVFDIILLTGGIP